MEGSLTAARRHHRIAVDVRQTHRRDSFEDIVHVRCRMDPLDLFTCGGGRLNPYQRPELRSLKRAQYSPKPIWPFRVVGPGVMIEKAVMGVELRHAGFFMAVATRGSIIRRQRGGTNARSNIVAYPAGI